MEPELNEMTCYRLENILHIPLVLASSQSFDFEQMWEQVDILCKSMIDISMRSLDEIRQESDCKSVIPTEEEHTSTETVTNELGKMVSQAYQLIYHMSAHPCVNVQQSDKSNYFSSEYSQITELIFRLQQLLTNYIKEHIEIKFNLCNDKVILCTLETYLQCWRSFVVIILNIQAVFEPVGASWKVFHTFTSSSIRPEYIARDIWASSILTKKTVEKLKNEYKLLCTCRQLMSYDYSFMCENLAKEFKDALLMLNNQSYYTEIIERTYLESLAKRSLLFAKRVQSEYMYDEQKERLFLKSADEHLHDYHKEELYKEEVEEQKKGNEPSQQLSEEYHQVDEQEEESEIEEEEESLTIHYNQDELAYFLHYAEKCLAFIEAETKRAGNFLKETTPAHDELVELLIDNKVEYFTEDFIKMSIKRLRVEEINNLRKVYQFFWLSNLNTQPLIVNVLKTYVKELTATELISLISAIDDKKNNKDYKYNVCDIILQTFANQLSIFRRVVKLAFDDIDRIMYGVEKGLEEGLLEAIEPYVDITLIAERLAYFANFSLLRSENLNTHSLTSQALQNNKQEANINTTNTLQVNTATKLEKEIERFSTLTEHSRKAHINGCSCESLKKEKIVALFQFVASVSHYAVEQFLHIYRYYLAERLLFNKYEMQHECQMLKSLALIVNNAELFYCRSMLNIMEHWNENGQECTEICLQNGNKFFVNPCCIRQVIWPLTTTPPVHAPYTTYPTASSSSTSFTVHESNLLLLKFISEKTMEKITPELHSTIALLKQNYSTKQAYLHHALSTEYSTAKISINARVNESNKIRILAHVTLTQLCILYLFNDKLEWHVKSLCATLQISKEGLVQSLESLLQIGILKVAAAETATMTSFPNVEMYCDDTKIIRPVCIELRNITIRDTLIEPDSKKLGDGVEICLIPNTTASTQHLLPCKATESTVEVDDKWVQMIIEVRALNYLKHNSSSTISELYHVICNSLHSYTITMPMIKAAVDRLLQRNYIERDEMEQIFRYIP